MENYISEKVEKEGYFYLLMQTFAHYYKGGYMMRKQMISFLLCLLLVFGVMGILTLKIFAQSTMPVLTRESIPEDHVRLHYIRTDYDYDGWGLHLWGAGYLGEPVDWTNPVPFKGMHDYGVYWDIPYQQGTDDLNFIIHKGDIKDPTPDREYLNPDENREIFCITGEVTAYLTLDQALAALELENLNIPPVPSEHVRLHYYRFDNNYDGWGLHLWGAGYAGNPIEWSNPLPISGFDTYGAYWDIPYNSGEDELNFIIHKGNEKDPDLDRQYINPDENRELWAISGDETAYERRLAAAKSMSNKIENAFIIGPRDLIISLRSPIKDPIYIKDKKKFVHLQKLDTSNAPIYRLTTRSDLDFSKTYTVNIGKMTSELALSANVIESFQYEGELGNFYTPEKTSFKLWAPIASQVKLLLYDSPESPAADQNFMMQKGENGLWSITIENDLLGKLYQYAVTVAGQEKIVLDPYAKSMGGFDYFNGNDKVGKGAIVDLSQTNPLGWKEDSYVKIEDQEDVIIYEISVRDFTIAKNSGITHEKRGTYLGFIEKIPYLKDLGITHVQLQPVQNFYYGNEYDRSFEEIGSAGEANYNWGYDPHNYNTPEGWYSSNPDDPHIRIKELKQLIKALHDAEIGVILDVVYNHTARTDILEDIVPNYYYRRNANGKFTSGSGCGNDTASERAMWRKFMIESTQYWVEEYHIDGFRFDLMGLHDETTMKMIAATLREINPDIILHGEGWNMGTLPEEDRYIKGSNLNHSLLEMDQAIAVFNDTLRDAMKHEYYASPLPEGGFLQAKNPEKEGLIRTGIIAGMVNYSSDVEIDTGSYHRFADDPEETITYVNCHDGYTIWDKITGSTPDYSLNEQIRVNKLAAAMILTSQGKPFLHGGEEILRSKPDPDNIEYSVDHNSYDSGDLTNQFDWSRVEKYADVLNYYQGLIDLRKSHPAFRMETMEEIQNGLEFIKEDIDYLIAFRLKEQDGEDKWQEIIVIYNANRIEKKLQISDIDENWQIVVDGELAGVKPLTETNVVIQDGEIIIPGISAVVLYK